MPVSEHEFGFSGESVGRERDPYAHLSPEDFKHLVDLSSEVMAKQGVTERSVAMEIAEAIQSVWNKSVYPGSGRIGIRKYGAVEFRRLAFGELTDGKEACVHGHLAAITDCGACHAQSRIDKYVQNPVTKVMCTHARIDIPAIDFSTDEIQQIPPCPAC